VQAVGALLVGVAYFLPWASFMSAFGSVQMRGLYVDYAWFLLILAIAHLLAQFAEPNREALGVPERWIAYMGLLSRITPFVIVGFFAWYGSNFAFNASLAASGSSVSLFGTEMPSVLKAGLDYGYWIGVCGAVVLLTSVGLLVKQAARFCGLALIVAVAAIGLAFGFTRSARQFQANKPASTISSQSPTAAVNPTGAATTGQSESETAFDVSPFVQVTSITGRLYGKNYEASRYSDSAIISVVFKNVGTKTIVGLRGLLSVLDGFGNDVYKFTFRDDEKITPGRDTGGTGGYSFEDNQFAHDEPYDKIAPLISGGTAKYSAKITQIAFEDGTILPQKK
jgi:hypothetical protein